MERHPDDDLALAGGLDFESEQRRKRAIFEGRERRELLSWSLCHRPILRDPSDSRQSAQVVENRSLSTALASRATVI